MTPPETYGDVLYILVSALVLACWSQLDVKNAFLNKDLAEEVYTKIPPRFGMPNIKHQLWKLKRLLRSFKQSRRAWFGRFTRVVQQQRYSQYKANNKLSVKKLDHNKLSILIVYVDDIIVTCDFTEEMINLKNKIWPRNSRMRT